MKIDYRGNGIYRDQLDSSKEYLYHVLTFRKILREKYNLTPKEYHNIIVYGDKNYFSKCIHCGKETKFKSIYKGWDDYCSKSCVTSKRLTEASKHGENPFQKNEFIEKNRKRVKENQKQRMKNGTHHFLKNDQKYISKRRYLKYGFETTNLYIGIFPDFPDEMKIGVSNNISSRSHYKNRTLSKKEIILTGSVEDILMIEEKIIEKFCNNGEIFKIKYYSDIKRYANELFIKVQRLSKHT